ncbi:sulfurase [Thioclava sp. SK-1]|uniref:MOSC domain-containing protein n=1 Tax=Thioclava sp. SK-1 TaxID=1889770 RepID=UPI0008263806|nr:sulfurase [Thioclava sp. SK-1]OCX65892.1 sulfurase [Thioclava sp. SK-1]
MSAALKPTEFSGEIVWLGAVPQGGFAAAPMTEMELDFEGPILEAHRGHTRPSCSRVLAQHPRGTEISNTRQVTILSAEEMAETAFAMGLPELKPEWVGASIILRGIPDFSHIPPSSRLQAPDGTTLIVDMENRPCVLPGKQIEMEHPGKGARYKPAAGGRRGVTGWVERPGRLKLGDVLRLHVPDQRRWNKADEALT